jgi:PAS domain S-box-containing protein
MLTSKGKPPSTGETARWVRDTDWSKTPLGPTTTWSAALKFGVETILASGFPMALRWGPSLIMIYNDAYGAILGDKHPSAFGRPFAEVWPEIHDELGPLSEAILRGEHPGFFAEDHPWSVCRHGRRVEDARFTISYSPISDETAPHGIGGVLTTVIETTNRVRTEERLRHLNDRLEEEVALRTRERDRIWQVSEDLLGVSNFAGYFLSINPAWTALLGWSREEICAMHVDELRHPDDAAHSRAGRQQLADGVPAVRIENRFRHKDGSWRWISWTMTAEQHLIYVIGRHMTDAKEAAQALRDSEQQFRLLVAGVTDYALFRLDTQGIVSSWNAGAERMKGYTESEIAGRHFSCFYTDEDRAAGVPKRALATARRTGKFETEGWRVRKDGSLFWASVVIDAIYDSSGALIGFAKITRDITEWRNAQQALQRAQEQLAQLQKMEALGQLTGGIAHDFNNMLMVVGGNAQLLKRRVIDPAARRAVEAIESAASRAENLTRQLLTFSRRQSLNPIVADLGERLAAFRDVLLSSLPGNVRLVINIERGTWPIAVDVPELELALLNVVVNARDAMTDGGLITIAARNMRLQRDDTADGLEGDFVALSIADTGTGIAPEVLPKVFEPFFTTKPVDKGTGLGLSQVYGFSRQSAGSVAIASKVGSGTTVTLYLPRGDVASVQELSGAQIEVGATAGETILLVEDNAEVSEVAMVLLDQLGYRTKHAENARAALRLLAENRGIDLVLSDIVMPDGMDGISLAREIEKRYPKVPVVLTTGYAHVSARVAQEFPILRKPYRLEGLSRAVSDALHTGRAKQWRVAGHAGP